MKTSDQQFRVVADRALFDERSGNALERIIFNHRLAILVIFAIVSVFLGWKSTQLTVNANFERMIPSSHAYIKKANFAAWATSCASSSRTRRATSTTPTT